MGAQLIDNVELFNRLTHSEDGSVDVKIFNKLLKNFHNYALFKSIIKIDHMPYVYKAEVTDKGKVQFRIKFDDNEIAEKFMDMDTTIKYKKRKFSIDFSRNGLDTIIISFEKE